MNEKDKNQLKPSVGKKEKKEIMPSKRKGSAFNENPIGHKDVGQKSDAPSMNEEDAERRKESNR